MIVVLLAGFTEIHPVPSRTGLWEMDGRRIVHFFEDQADSLSNPEIVELQDENGLTVWFGRKFYKDVCITGECKMIRLTLFWDGAGNYLGMDIPAEEPLTKSDHTEFEAADYEKLENILRDTASILKNLKPDDLIAVPDSIDVYKAYEVDGYTAATRPALAEVVVKDAVYTCHTLWHTVYGPTHDRINEILMKRLSLDFLTLMFESRDPSKIAWAIQRIDQHFQYHSDLYPLIMRCIKSENAVISEQAFQYFQVFRLADIQIQKQLVELMPDLPPQKKNDLIWRFIEFGRVSEDVVLDLLKLFQQQRIGIGSLNLIYRLVLPEYLIKNNQILKVVQNLSEHEDAYVRNLTARLLNTKTGMELNQ